MQKLLLFLTLLFVGVFTTACINTYAVKQLNDIAIEYLDAGDVASAVSRLEASVDLDGNIYESRYNLAVSYFRIGECKKALDNIMIAKSLKKKDEPAVYYTIGIANNCLANQIYEKVNTDGTKEEIKYDEPFEAMNKAKEYVYYLTEANKNFDIYTKLMPNAEDTKSVLENMRLNEEKIASKKETYE